ncbi:septal ring lytic transglycosylase RlpA family protein [Polymorphum gilvum]|uniref:Endolytic peptidoglycan transglycosylase RlpA n=1 Tax=Polymorphum gilvum (strain LMG 25793 / CGMCC 1.9160 / SL003B-26A1) TaxID=991905 RepID=F2IYD2_POLGS|nr:septal ring lytic transglycosylase RlpA family protein [Polymorphum gilvum]ADZ68445.1 Rare lipoprotein A-like double-psi beta-barrel [Polymorphum gilvum SL003B-26A1]
MTPACLLRRGLPASLHLIPLLVCALAVAIPARTEAAPVQCGLASWYQLTSRTASGERADPETLTAAHRSLPFGSLVTVVNRDNGRSVTLRVNDRGPFVKNRIIDVSRRAARELGFVDKGVTRVQVVAAGNAAYPAPKVDCP